LYSFHNLFSVHRIKEKQHPSRPPAFPNKSRKYGDDDKDKNALVGSHCACD